MPNYNVYPVKESVAYDFSWRSLRKYHDVLDCTDRLMNERGIPVKHRQNVEKQMRQLSYCLRQGFEFSQSAKASSLSTKALQAYYSLTSLANVEILWKGNGDDAIDRRPGVTHRHGLNLTTSSDLEECAAVPQTTSTGNLSGLFGLWRNYAHHVPHYGKMSSIFQDRNTTQEKYIAMSTVSSLVEKDIPIQGIPLSECLAHIPGMQMHLASTNRNGKIARAQLRMLRTFSGMTLIEEERQVIIQPCPDALRDKIVEKFRFQPALFENIQFYDTLSGSMFKIVRREADFQYSVSLPDAFSDSNDDIYFVDDGDTLNEFGYFYVGLYIMSMISRYHPQIWIRELTRSSAITALIDEFVDLSLIRVPLLTLGQLEETVFVYKE